MVLAVHVNFKSIQQPPEGTPEYKTATENPPKPEEILGRLQPFGYALEQGTRPSTIGIVAGCNPLSLLAWYVALSFQYTQLIMSTILPCLI